MGVSCGHTFWVGRWANFFYCRLLAEIKVMKLISRILILVLFIGEVISQIYNSSSYSNKAVISQLDSEILAFRNSDQAVLRRAQRDKDIAEITKSTEAKNQRNLIALSSSDAKTRDMYDEKIRKDSAEKLNIRAEYDKWENAEIERIKNKYDEIAFYSANGSIWARAVDVVYGPLASLLALVLAGYSAMLYDWRKYASLVSAFIAQLFASMLAYGGMVDKVGQIEAYAGFVAFFICIPLAYNIASEFSAMMPTVTVRRTHSVGHVKTRSVEWEISAKGWEMAIAELAKERKLGNGVGMLNRISDHFGINRGVVHRQLKRALEGKQITVPEKLLPKQVRETSSHVA